MKTNETVSGVESANACRCILIIDSDFDVRQLSVDVLVGAGYFVDAVENGVAGWKAVQAAHYDLVITDHRLLGMTGMEMVEKMRVATMGIPVIIAARHLPTFEFYRKPWLKPVVMLQRPFSNDELLEAVKDALCPDSRNAALLVAGAAKREPALELAGKP